MKVIYNLLVVVAGVALLLGVVIKVFMGDANLPAAWLVPQTLWRGAIGAVGFAAVFLLMDIRDILLKKG